MREITTKTKEEIITEQYIEIISLFQMLSNEEKDIFLKELGEYIAIA